MIQMKANNDNRSAVWMRRDESTQYAISKFGRSLDVTISLSLFHLFFFLLWYLGEFNRKRRFHTRYFFHSFPVCTYLTMQVASDSRHFLLLLHSLPHLTRRVFVTNDRLKYIHSSLYFFISRFREPANEVFIDAISITIDLITFWI